MLKPIFVKAFLLAGSMSMCPAQETWGGLQFGMKLDEVKKVLGDRIQESDPTAKGQPDEYAWHIKSVKVGEAEGTGNLMFDKSTDRLVRVGLYFAGDLLKNKGKPCRGGTTPEQNAHVVSIITDVSDKLLENYGKPVKDIGWPTQDDIINHLILGQPNIQASRMWKPGGQIIEETLFLPCTNPIIYVVYKPATKGEL